MSLNRLKYRLAGHWVRSQDHGADARADHEERQIDAAFVTVMEFGAPVAVWVLWTIIAAPIPHDP
jgi:hypothetical protein